MNSTYSVNERERDERGDLKIYFEMGEIILACFELGREERSAVWQNAIPHYKYYKYCNNYLLGIKKELQYIAAFFICVI